jgi:translation initiation factor IF-1
MVKIEGIELDAEITAVLPAGNYKAKPKDMDIVILCKKSWKMRSKQISVIEWDWVKLEVSPYDMSKGRIIYRYGDYAAAQRAAADREAQSN